MSEPLKIKTGNIYKTADGRAVMVYNYNSVHNVFECVVVDEGAFYSVDHYGKYFQSQSSNNDLVEVIK